MELEDLDDIILVILYNTKRLSLQNFENSSPFSSANWWYSKHVDDVNVSNVRLWKGYDSWCSKSQFPQQNILQLLHRTTYAVSCKPHFLKASNERLVLQIHLPAEFEMLPSRHTLLLQPFLSTISLAFLCHPFHLWHYFQ